jgi:hypothetical protein
VSEGGIWWNPGQTGSEPWVCGERPISEPEFMSRYEALTETLQQYPRMCAPCYTQLHDVEQEADGLYRYARYASFERGPSRDMNVRSATTERKGRESLSQGDQGPNLEREGI